MKHHNPSPLVSIHGGHSGEFCNHADDNLEAIIHEYIRKKFSWVGITEHMPPVNDRYLYEDEVKNGLDAEQIFARFKRYMGEIRKLQKKYRPLIEIFAGFETETYTGSHDFVKDLVKEFEPDYIVGSVHHVNDLPFDTSREHYQRAVEFSGGINELYCDYFDLQYEMIHAIRPRVVGHFDLIRIFDPDYSGRLKTPVIWEKIKRNLTAVKELDIIMDLNMRALNKGAAEPYIARPILQLALEFQIPVVPGDDSHSVDTAGRFIEDGIRILQDLGVQDHCRKPVP